MADSTGNGLHEAHINIEALSGRVESFGTSLTETRNQFNSFQNEVRASLDRQSAQTFAQIKDLGDKIEKQGRESAVSRQFSVSNFLTVSVSVGGFLAIIGGALFYPFVTQQSRIEQSIEKTNEVIARINDAVVKKDDFREYVDSASKEADKREATGNIWISKVQSRLQLDEDGAVTQRQMLELKDKLDERYSEADKHWGEVGDKIKALTDRVVVLDASLVKRPEIQAGNDAQDKLVSELNQTSNDRIAALSASLAALRADFNSISPLNNVIRDLQDRLAHQEARPRSSAD